MQTKICTKCNVEKALTEFHKDKKGKYGVRSHCKECKREYRQQPEVKRHTSKYYREYRQRPEVKEYRREYQREYDQKPGMRERRRELTRELMKDPVRIERKRKRNREDKRLRKEMGLVSNRCVELARKNARRNSEPWSDAEVKFLMSSELQLIDIALELGRSYPSVSSKRQSLRKLQDAA